MRYFWQQVNIIYLDFLRSLIIYNNFFKIMLFLWLSLNTRFYLIGNVLYKFYLK